MPYSWGDVRYSKTGIDYSIKAIKKDPTLYDKKNKKLLRPTQIPFFYEKREQITEKINENENLKGFLDNINNKYAKIKKEVKMEEKKIEEVKDLKFPI